MSDDLRARLIAAAAAGEIVSIVYHRGSQPGAVRDIVPITITGRRSDRPLRPTSRTFRRSDGTSS
jgi:hypothetical protein